MVCAFLSHFVPLCAIVRMDVKRYLGPWTCARRRCAPTSAWASPRRSFEPGSEPVVGTWKMALLGRCILDASLCILCLCLRSDLYACCALSPYLCGACKASCLTRIQLCVQHACSLAWWGANNVGASASALMIASAQGVHVGCYWRFENPTCRDLSALTVKMYGYKERLDVDGCRR